MNSIYEQLKIDRTVPIPLYYQIKTFMIKHIEDNSLKDGELVPPEEELCAYLNVSRPTVRQAFLELVHEGYLNRIKSKGTFVTRPKIAGDFIQKIQTYNQEIQYYGLKPKTKLLSISEIDVFAEVMEKLKLTEKDKVICLERLRYADDKPIVYVKTFIPVKLCKGLIDEDLEQNSLYDTLKTKYNIEIAHINRQIHATVADPYLSDLLGIMENAPLLYITTVAYNQNDIPFEYSLASYRADMYKMNVDLYKDKYYK